MAERTEAPNVSKVGTDSDPGKVAGALAGMFREHGDCIARAIGGGAGEVMARALAIAREFVRRDSAVTWLSIAFCNVEVEAADPERECTALEVTVERCLIPRLVRTVKPTDTTTVGGEEETGALAASFVRHFKTCGKTINPHIVAENSYALNALLKGLARATTDVMSLGAEVRFNIIAPRKEPDVVGSGWPIRAVCYYFEPGDLEQ